MQRLRASALLLLLALGLVIGGRALADHGAAGCTVTPSSVVQGGTIRVSGSTNTPNEPYVVRLDGTQIDAGTTEDEDPDDREDGHFEETHQLTSAQSTLGTRTITVVATSGTLTCTFAVTAATPTPSPTPTATATARPTATPTDKPDPTRAPPSRRGQPRLNVLGDDKFKRGETVKATAARITPNENYNLDFAQSPGTIVARGTSNRLGSVRFEFKIPSNARTGSATLTALPADGSGLQASARITIEGGSAGGGSGGGGKSLPATGRNVAVYTTLAMLLLLGGLSMQRYEWLHKAPDRRADPVIALPKRFWG